jgi:membrane-bound lytic murein transglycosylase D
MIGLLLGTALGDLLAREARYNELEYPTEMKLKVEFWKAIYTKYTTRQGLLHDAEDLSVIYDAIQLPSDGSTISADELRYHIRTQLFEIVRHQGQNLTDEQRKLLSRFPAGTTRARLIQATENIRFQLGQADRFKQGIIRSGAYLHHIEKIIADMELPDFLKYLPHVESSFQEFAFSKIGAAGLWQLMESTGRMFNLRSDYAVDERLDPWLATAAAMKHLKRDHAYLGRWPLAITAYNHGPGGVKKAMQTLGTGDIAEIAFRYQSPSFGFASRNFYAQFLAAVEVASNYKKYFGELPVLPTLEFDTVHLNKPTYYKDFAKNYRFTPEEFKMLNPALRPPVLQNSRPIPSGMNIRVPLKSKKTEPVQIASIEKKSRIRVAEPKNFELKQVPEIKSVSAVPVAVPQVSSQLSPYRVMDAKDGNQGWIRMEINETVSQVADWLEVDLAQVRDWNGLGPDEQARLGQKLLIKFKGKTIPQFEIARKEYHQKIKEDFFSQYEVSQLSDYQVKKGENLWSLCNQKFEIPAWLLQEYNPNISVAEISAGAKIKVPVLRERNLSMANSN